MSEEENKKLENYNKLERLPYELIDNNRDFKVVKTPISNRTLIIGGKTSKEIKEIYKEDRFNIKVFYLCFILYICFLFYWDIFQIINANLNYIQNYISNWHSCLIRIISFKIFQIIYFKFLKKINYLN